MELVTEIRESADRAASRNDTHADWQAVAKMASDAAQTVEDVAKWLVERNDHAPQAAAVNILELFGIALGGWAMADAAMAAADEKASGATHEHLTAKLKMVRFYQAHVFAKLPALKSIVFDANDEVLGLESEDFSVA
jgi:hypothetical protein